MTAATAGERPRPVTPATELTPVDRLPVPAGQDPTQCHSFGRNRAGRRAAAKAHEQVADLLDMLLTLRGSSDARTLYERYLTSGVMSGERHRLKDRQTLAEFRDDPATKRSYANVRKALLTALRAEPPPTASGPFSLRHVGVGTDLKINYTPRRGNLLTSTTTPALIAGGGGGRPATGSLISQRGTFHDTRDIVGAVRIVTQVEDGVITRAEAQLSDVVLRVQDSIDLCPGGLGSSGAARELTLPMSRLERTPTASGVGGWTQPVLWSVEVPLASSTLDVTDLYRGQTAKGS